MATRTKLKALCLSGGVAVFALASSHEAQAGEFSASVGAAATMSPDYEGSNNAKLGGLPFLILSWQADAPTKSGLQVGLPDITLNLPGSLEVGVVKIHTTEGLYRLNLGLAYDGGRGQSDNAALKGMGEIGDHVLASAAVNFEAKGTGWRSGLSLSRDISHETDGTVLDGRLGYVLPLNEALVLTTTGSASWADKNHMQSYFGVTQAQAAASSNARFEARSGLKSMGIEAELNWTVNESWMLAGSLGYTRLMNDAAASPLVKTQGSPDQVNSMLALIYTF